MINKTISHYKILEKLGEGGMGVVYKAQDTKLNRTVALKFLPEHISASESDTARFMQEAQAAASLSHPNICTIHGIEEADGKHFIVMEFVDGQMLQEKRSSLSMKQSLDIGIQIAEGLAAAHDKGIVHRDIKPENIMIRKDGRVQIMDFGLAKLRGASRLTKEGSTVGTVGYMSPEQVQGEETDHRSDIFSLGVLLYEMLAGQPPFKGMHETAIGYEVVNVDSPPLSTIKPEISPELDAIVMECLEKDANERAQSAKQIAVDLKRFKRASSRSRMSMTMPARMLGALQRAESTEDRAGLHRVVKYFPWIVTTIVILFSLAWILFGEKGTATRANHLNIAAVSSSGRLIYSSDKPMLDLSPDGRTIVYTLSASGVSQLYVRSLDSYEARPLQGTANGTAPFFSPDGQWIGFIVDGKLKKIPTVGGTAESLCDAEAFRGASWGPDNRIYYSPYLSSGIFSVSASGGDIKPVTTLDSSKGERTHRWPQVLPGGKWILYTVGNQANPNSYTDAILMIQSIQTGERHELNVRGEKSRYVEPGYLVVGRGGSLLVAPFSLDNLQISKTLVPVVDGVSSDPGSGIVHFSVSAQGDLVYLPGSLSRDFRLVWATRDGQINPLPLQPQQFNTPRLSPDNSRLAFSMGITTGDNDIWIYDLIKETTSRLTFSKQVNSPLWSSDGRDIFYASAVPLGIMMQPSDGSSKGVYVLKSPIPVFPAGLADGGRRLITSSLGASDISMMDLEKGTGPTLLISGKPNAYEGSVSPDNRFLVFGATESGRLEVYVHSFPDLKGKWQISSQGGFNPVWSPKGDEIFFVSTDGNMMAVSVKTSPVFSPGAPRELFDVSQMSFPNSPVRNYDISNDGKRFLMVQNTTGYTRNTSFNYVQNWMRELEEKLR